MEKMDARFGFSGFRYLKFDNVAQKDMKNHIFSSDLK